MSRRAATRLAVSWAGHVTLAALGCLFFFHVATFSSTVGGQFHALVHEAEHPPPPPAPAADELFTCADCGHKIGPSTKRDLLQSQNEVFTCYRCNDSSTSPYFVHPAQHLHRTLDGKERARLRHKALSLFYSHHHNHSSGSNSTGLFPMVWHWEPVQAAMHALVEAPSVEIAPVPVGCTVASLALVLVTLASMRRSYRAFQSEKKKKKTQQEQPLPPAPLQQMIQPAPEYFLQTATDPAMMASAIEAANRMNFGGDPMLYALRQRSIAAQAPHASE